MGSPRFEYKVVGVWPDDFPNGDLTFVVNKWAKLGWRLVSASANPKGQFHLFFGRQLDEQQQHYEDL